MVESDRPDDSIIQRMRFTCRITKATDTRSESYILLLHVDNGYANVPQYYVICALSLLFTEL